VWWSLWISLKRSASTRARRSGGWLRQRSGDQPAGARPVCSLLHLCHSSNFFRRNVGHRTDDNVSLAVLLASIKGLPSPTPPIPQRWVFGQIGPGSVAGANAFLAPGLQPCRPSMNSRRSSSIRLDFEDWLARNSRCRTALAHLPKRSPGSIVRRDERMLRSPTSRLTRSTEPSGS